MIDFKLNNLKILSDDRGFVQHGMKINDNNSFGIREVYFSSVNYGFYKGWKKHTRMVLNIIVVQGEINFYLANNKFSEFKEIKIARDDYKRLTIMPNQWMAFTSNVKPSSTIINIANLCNKEDITENLPFFKPK